MFTAAFAEQHLAQTHPHLRPQKRLQKMFFFNLKHILSQDVLMFAHFLTVFLQNVWETFSVFCQQEEQTPTLI